MIGDDATRDGQQPGSGARASGESPNGADRPQKGFLGQVVGAGHVRQIGDESPHVLLSGFDELLQGPGVAVGGCERQRGNGLVVATRGHAAERLIGRRWARRRSPGTPVLSTMSPASASSAARGFDEPARFRATSNANTMPTNTGRWLAMRTAVTWPL